MNGTTSRLIPSSSLELPSSTFRQSASKKQPGIGDYVASGIGLTGTSSYVSSDSASVTSTTSSVNTPLSAKKSLSSGALNGTAPLSSFSSAPLVSVTSASIQFQNVSVNNSINPDQCWTQWSSYWVANASVDTVETTLGSGGTTFFTTTGTNFITYSSEPEYTTTYTIIQSVTRTIGANGFTASVQRSTLSSTFTDVVTPIYSSDSTESITYTLTSTKGPGYIEITPAATLPTPRCTLPAYVSQCESEWQIYESALISLVELSEALAACTDSGSGACSASYGGRISALNSLRSVSSDPPFCSQASIGTSLCETLRDNYISGWLESQWQYGPGWLGSVGVATNYSTAQNGSRYPVEFWPSTSALGPECSLGCARCAVSGGTVQLIYWPASETTNGTAPLVAPALSTFFTYPTVYISFDSVYASDSCSGVGSTHGATILAIPNSLVLSSVWAAPGDNAPQTAFFNFTDLNTPIPQSIYDRQPQCAAYSIALWSDPYKDIVPGNGKFIFQPNES